MKEIVLLKSYSLMESKFVIRKIVWFICTSLRNGKLAADLNKA